MTALEALQGMSRPLAIDLCCGLGGWTYGLQAAGWDVVGFDILPFPAYPAPMAVQDILTLDGRRLRGAQLIVASPPCQEFSRHDIPQCRARNPPEPDLGLRLVEACYRIAREAGCPLVLENVRGAQKWLGKRVWQYEGAYLWGDGVLALAPPWKPRSARKKYGWKTAEQRSVIPYELALWIGQCHLP